MRHKNRAWILLPASIVVAAVIGIVVSSYQKEAGLVEVGRSQRAAVAAVAEARDIGARPDAEYGSFSEALLIAVVAHRSAAITNPADTRVANLVVKALDCLTALREAWQAHIDGYWDPETHGSIAYWSMLHPTLDIPEGPTMTFEDIRRIATDQAGRLIDQAVDLVE
jgi:hypothetical protein